MSLMLSAFFPSILGILNHLIPEFLKVEINPFCSSLSLDATETFMPALFKPMAKRVKLKVRCPVEPPRRVLIIITI